FSTGRRGARPRRSAWTACGSWDTGSLSSRSARCSLRPGPCGGYFRRSPRRARPPQRSASSPRSRSSSISSGCPRCARPNSGMRSSLRYRAQRPEVWMAATFERASVTAELARAMIEAAERKAAEMGQPFVIAVVDDSGVLKAFSRMDGAPLVSVQVAQDKAYTAVGFGLATDAWHDFVKNDPPLAMGAAPGIDRLIVFGGGYPIKVGEAVVGGIGVSGGHYS